MAKKDYGRTRGGEEITEELVEKRTTKAEEGFDVDEILRRGDRSNLGSDRLRRFEQPLERGDGDE